MASDIDNQLIIKLQQSQLFLMQLDEPPNVRNKAILLLYVKHIDKEDSKIYEKFLIEPPGYKSV